MEQRKVDSKFFEDVKYFSTGNINDEVLSLLANGGAKSYKYAIDMMSHCIAGDGADTSVIEEVRDIFQKPVVHPEWVVLSTYTSKLLPVEPFDPKLPPIFKNIVVTFSQITKNDAKKLWALLKIYGGKFQPNLNSQCTHLISTKASGKKYEEALKRNNVTIVTPDWVVDCSSEKNLLPVDSYHPSLLIDPMKPNVPVTNVEEHKPIPKQIDKIEDIKVGDIKITNEPKVIDKSAELKNVDLPPVQPKENIVVTAHSRMRVASNLPPHLEQQLQQHSMMRNNSPRQQHQNLGGAGVRVRSSLGPQMSLRPGGQQHIIIQRTSSHQPRQFYTVQQVRAPTQQPKQQDDSSLSMKSSIVSSQAVTSQVQTSTVQQTILRQGRIGPQPLQSGTQQQPNHLQIQEQTKQTGALQQQNVQHSVSADQNIQQDPSPQTQSVNKVLQQTTTKSTVSLEHQPTGTIQHVVQLQQTTGQQQSSTVPQKVHLIAASHLQQLSASQSTLRQQQIDQKLQQQGQGTSQNLQQQAPQNVQLTQVQLSQQPDYSQPLQQQQQSMNQVGYLQQQQQNIQHQQQTGNVNSSILQMVQQQSADSQTFPSQQVSQSNQQNGHSQVVQQHILQTHVTQQPTNIQSTLQQQQSGLPQTQQQISQHVAQPGNSQVLHQQQFQQTYHQQSVRPQLVQPQTVRPQGTYHVLQSAQHSSLQMTQGVGNSQHLQQHVDSATGQQPQLQTVQQHQQPSQPMQQSTHPQQQQGQLVQPIQNQPISQQLQTNQTLQPTQDQGGQIPSSHAINQPGYVVQHQLQQQQHQMQQQQQQQIAQHGPVSTLQQQTVRQPSPNQFPGPQGVVRPGMQPPGTQQPQPQIRQLTFQQQQYLQMHIQNMNPQAKQQLQQMNPQMKSLVFQKILQQHELQMQQQLAKRMMQQQEEGVQQQEGNQQQDVLKRQQLTQQLMMQKQMQQQVRQPFPQQQNQRMSLNPQQGNLQPEQQVVSQQPLNSGIQQTPSQQNQPPMQQPQQTSPQVQLPVRQVIQPVQSSQQQQQPNQHPQAIRQPSQPISQQPQQQLQQQEQQSNSVNPKTKTALANLLSTRLQTTPTQQQQLVAHPLTPQQHQQLIGQQQRQSLQNITNGTNNSQASVMLAPNSSAVPANLIQQQAKAGPSCGPLFNVGVRMPGTPVAGPPGIRREFPQQQQLFGHEPGFKVPEHLCLLGCVVFVADYNRTVIQSELQQWIKLITSNGGEVESVYSQRVTHVLCETSRSPVAQQALREGKRLITAFWLNDVIMKEQMLPPSQVLHFPTSSNDGDRPCKNMMVSISGFEGEDRIRVRYMCENIGLTCTGHFSNHHDLLVCRKPDGTKYQKAREWRKPVVSLNWLAEMHFGYVSALQQIHHPKYQQFNLQAYVQEPFKFDLNMAASLLAAWRVPIKVTQETYEKFKTVAQLRNKRSSSGNVGTDAESPSKKKAKLDDEERDRIEKSSNLDAILDDVAKGGFDPEAAVRNRPVVRFSGLEATELSKYVVRLGGTLAVSNKDVTHLVMPSLKRTPKFLCCLPTVKHVLSSQWIQDSIQQGKLLDEQPYQLRDSDLEKKFDFDLPKLLGIPNKDQLFKSKTFYITPSVVPSRSVLREIIECSGGKVVAQRKSLKSIMEMNQNEENSFMVIACETDFHLVSDLIKNKIGLYYSEYVMTAVLTQQLVCKPFLISV